MVLKIKWIHFTNFYQVILDLDVVAITETSPKNDDFFKTNVAIKGDDSYFTPSSSEKGSVAIYTKDKLN